MSLIEHNAGTVTVVELSGRIDTNSSAEIGERLLQLLESGRKRLVLDLRDTLYVSSAGFRALLIAARAADKSDGKLVLSGLSSEVQRLFSLGAFTDLFFIRPSRDDAIAACAD